MADRPTEEGGGERRNAAPRPIIVSPIVIFNPPSAPPRTWHWRLLIFLLVAGSVSALAWYKATSIRRSAERDLSLDLGGRRDPVSVPDRVRAQHGVPSVTAARSGPAVPLPTLTGSNQTLPPGSCDPPYIHLGNGAKVDKPGCR